MEFYGFFPWIVIQRITLPLCVFFRFHSTVISTQWCCHLNMNFVFSVLGEAKWVQLTFQSITGGSGRALEELVHDQNQRRPRHCYLKLSFSISYFLFNSCILFSLRKATWQMRKKHIETIYASYKWFVSTLNWRDWSPFAILLKGQNISYSPALFRWLAQMSKHV